MWLFCAVMQYSAWLMSDGPWWSTILPMPRYLATNVLYYPCPEAETVAQEFVLTLNVRFTWFSNYFEDKNPFHLFKKCLVSSQTRIIFNIKSLTCNGPVVVSMVVTTDLSTKSLAAVARNREATANEAKTIENQTTLPFIVLTLWICCQPWRLVCWQNSWKLFFLLSRSSGVGSILNATIVWTKASCVESSFSFCSTLSLLYCRRSKERPSCRAVMVVGLSLT